MQLTIEEALAKGMKALDNGQHEEAEQFFSLILSAKADHADANHGMGLLAFAVGKSDKAVGWIGNALQASPNNGHYWRSFIFVLLDMGMQQQAEAALDQARKQSLDAEDLAQLEALFPKSEASAPAPGTTLSQDQSDTLSMLLEKERFEEAAQMARTLLTQHPDSVLLHNVMGAALGQLNQHEEAQESFRQALALAPDFAQTHYYQGVAFKEAGDLIPAKDSLWRAIALDPTHIDAHYELCLIKRFSEEDDHLRIMTSLHGSEDLSPLQRCRLCFSLSKAHEDLGHLDQAFAYLKQGNAIRKDLLGYDISQDQTLFEEIYSYQKLLQQDHFSVAEAPDDIIPIFVLGMPRSGTTLVEQILSAHSLVGAAGEVGQIGALGEALVREQSHLSDKVIEDFRAMYKSVLQKRAEQAGSSGHRLIVDKMPQNFRFINLICSLFPEAWIIHVDRDPRAICWSNFKTNFSVDGLGYCYDIDDVLAYFDLYKDLMAHWYETYPDRIYHLDYEALVESPDIEARKLIDHLGLSWNDELLQPQDNKRIARTASQQQVRKGIYKGSSQQWRKFEPYLDGAFDRLTSGES